MSRARAVADRIPRDAYYTPDDLARALVRLLPIRPGDSVWEPHAGGGAFVRALLDLPGVVVHASDISEDAPGANPDRPSMCWHGYPGCDFLEMSLEPRPAWVIGNPPYRDAEAHIRHAIRRTGRHVAFLLRLGILESRRRAELWRDHPPRRVFVLSERPSFTGGGTDSAAYALFWWDAGHSEPDTALQVVSWKP